MASVQDAVDKWKRQMLGAAPTIKAGVMAVTVAPGQQAAAAADLWAQRVAESKDKFRTNVGAVSLQAWQTAMVDKGLARLTTGVNGAMPKVQAFMAQLIPYTNQVRATIRSMPKGSEADSEARMLAASRMMRAFAFQRRS